MSESHSKFKKTILCVDDTPANLMLLNECLKERYRVKLVNSGEKALQLLQTSEQAKDIHMVLLDVMMPGMDGFEVCRILRSQPHTEFLPIIFITAKNTPEDEKMALGVGGNDFITKPINPEVLLSRISTQLHLEDYQAFLRSENSALEFKLEQTLLDAVQLQEATLSVMVSLAEFRDEETGYHIKRTQLYIQALAKQASKDYPELGITENQIAIISKCAPLHDVGKITTPDEILLKPGKLTEEEFEIMKQHTQKGYDILRRAADQMGHYGEFLSVAQQIALSHHEKWNGQGYPENLSGDAIPLPARLMALVDVYDALRSERTYKKSFTHEKSLAIISEGKGSHFDPLLVDSFMKIEKNIEALSEKFKDSI
ncbi:HD domain-containing phosphohydrolase [Thiomicrorhabdus indica]|uniref:HD domain-containing phosphohydrolase n=1 Tax=Thiomicrorhabdus indica TaxID=2267253 RepID=UPI00102D7DB3|nr:HD domain-containing phosphohydrolase [Thiomicrorhabdus indica]